MNELTLNPVFPMAVTLREEETIQLSVAPTTPKNEHHLENFTFRSSKVPFMHGQNLWLCCSETASTVDYIWCVFLQFLKEYGSDEDSAVLGSKLPQGSMVCDWLNEQTRAN